MNSTLDKKTIELFLKISKKEIKKGNCHFINRNLNINGKKINSKQALLDIGIMKKETLWNYILELEESDCVKIDFDYNKKMDNNTEIYVFKKLINKKEIYIKLTMRQIGVICISFHESYKKVRKMKEKMYCYNCDNHVEIIKSKRENTYTIHNQDITFEEDCYKCKNCGEELIDEVLDTSLNKIYDKYLELYNLSIKKIKNIRISLNLSQELFAKALGWSKKTITRYELGQSLPQKEYLTVYQKLQENKNEILNILKRNKKIIGKNDYYKILKKVNTNIKLKTIHTFLYLLKNNPLYETQIMKHLFAVDFESQKELNVPITAFAYAHAPYGPIIDNRDEIMNYLLNNNYLKIVCINDDRVRFVANQEYDSNLFTPEEKNILEKVKKKLNGKTSIELSNWSHNFIGWQETKNGQIISYKKYTADFNLDKGW